MNRTPSSKSVVEEWMKQQKQDLLQEKQEKQAKRAEKRERKAREHQQWLAENDLHEGPRGGVYEIRTDENGFHWKRYI